jgi:ATP-dependent DNA ligase
MQRRVVAVVGELAAYGIDQLVFFAFDLLHLNGESTAQLPLIKRKERLQRLF